MKLACQTILLAFLSVPGLAQDSVAPKVALPLLATDSHHRPTTIAVDSLVVTDEKIRVAGATLLRGTDLPLDLGIAIDESNSQREVHLDDFVSASKQLAVSLIRGPEDRVFFLTFDVSPHATGWLNKEQLERTTPKVLVGGGTAVYDAVAVACQQRMGPPVWQKPARRVLLLISDGEDNQSHVSRDDAILEALKAGTVILTINPSNAVPARGEDTLEKFSKLTGGESFSGFSRKDLPKVFSSIQELIDGMYYVTYVPPNPSKNALHEIEIKRASKEKFELSYPRKYFWNP